MSGDNDGPRARAPAASTSSSPGAYREHGGGRVGDVAGPRAPPFFRPDTKLLVPPLNCSMVASGVWRSGHPLPLNFAFLDKLALRTIIYVGDKNMQAAYLGWAQERGIRVHHIRMESCKLPFVENDPGAVTAALEVLADGRNLPVLVHSDKGKHRVGVLVGAMRKILQNWSLASVFDEYSQFAAGKEDGDIEFIEIFQARIVYDPAHAPRWLRAGAGCVARPE
ncbi:tyrosine phosphatase family-domain-containing protein [Dipodascopsis tothii]|uniref:tyrosine phosphatase family-domain-containing protein n=1 Tax=Dipodascopsis tothii TaxID=44089 RepID=UPI0034CF2806